MVPFIPCVSLECCALCRILLPMQRLHRKHDHPGSIPTARCSATAIIAASHRFYQNNRVGFRKDPTIQLLVLRRLSGRSGASVGLTACRTKLGCSDSEGVLQKLCILPSYSEVVSPTSQNVCPDSESTLQKLYSLPSNSKGASQNVRCGDSGDVPQTS